MKEDEVKSKLWPMIYEYWTMARSLRIQVAFVLIAFVLFDPFGLLVVPAVDLDLEDAFAVAEAAAHSARLATYIICAKLLFTAIVGGSLLSSLARRAPRPPKDEAEPPKET